MTRLPTALTLCLALILGSGCDVLGDFIADLDTPSGTSSGSASPRPSSKPTATPVIPFRLGSRTITPAPETRGGTVDDKGTGLTFAFPEGGSGDLITAAITDGPKAPLSGKDFYVSYGGKGTIRLQVPVAAGERVYLLGYGVMAGSASDRLDKSGRWRAIAPVAEDGATALFELVMPALTTQQAIPNNAWQGFNHYSLARIKPGDSTATRMRLVEEQAAEDVENWLNALPKGLQDAARREVAGRLRYRVYADGNYYIGFTRRRLLGNSTTAMLGLMPDVDQNVLAHEVGHYMSHVLAGDARYLALEDLAPDANHGIGVAHPRRSTITEDYAYFSQYFLRGSIGGGDPTDPRAIFGSLSPAQQDFPSTEGFAAVLLACLHRQNATMRDFTGSRSEAPVVGADFADILALYAHGAPTVTELRRHVETFLAGRGEAGKLPAMAERIGWSYNGMGTVLGDGDKKPAGGVTVQNVVVVDGKEYTTPAVTSDSDGSFTLPRMFPGTSTLRLTKDGQTREFPVVTSWDVYTNDTLNLGNYYVAQGLTSNPTTKSRLDYLHECTQAALNVTYTQSGESGSKTTNVSSHGYPAKVSWSGANFSVSGTNKEVIGSVSITEDMSLSGSLSPDGGKLLNVQGHSTITTVATRNGVTTTKTSTTSLGARDLEFGGSGLGGSEWRYGPGTGPISNYVTGFSITDVSGTPTDVRVVLTRPGS